jgi:hypothetical protein
MTSGGGLSGMDWASESSAMWWTVGRIVTASNDDGARFSDGKSLAFKSFVQTSKGPAPSASP